MKIKILNDLTISPLKYSNMWRLVKTWRVKIDSDTIRVKKGFETDFASVPRLAWWFCSPAGGLYRQPAVLHDWMYVEAYKTKDYADKVFLHFMRDMGVGFFKRNLMYLAVKLFGRGNY